MNERIRETLDRNGRRVGAAGTLLLVGALLAGVNSGGTAATTATSVPAAVPAGAEARTIGDGRDSYAPVVADVSPAVVTIRTERVVQASQRGRMPFFDDPMFREFFGPQFRQQPPQPRREGGLGSGVLVSRDGYILTNHHVVSDSGKIAVELKDRRSFDAKLVGSDEATDLAVLKIDASELPVLPLGDSDAVEVGDVVLAVGNPLGVGQTVTLGIISAKGRATGVGDGSFEDFLQTDAPINRGNSGGALVSTNGELVGINSQILSPSGGNIGIGFAIPANMARSVMDQLIEHGEVQRSMLGVTIQQVNADLAKSLGLEKVGGALVSSVGEGSPAEKAGVKRGDVIVAIDGKQIADSNQLRNQVAMTAPGSEVKLTVVRNGKTQSLTAKLTELPSSARAAAGENGESANGGYGLEVKPVTPELAERLELDSKAGVVVTGVAPDGPAAAAGIQRGDVIQEVNRKPVNNVDELKSALAAAKGRPSLVLVHRDGSSLYLALESAQG